MNAIWISSAPVVCVAFTWQRSSGAVYASDAFSLWLLISYSLGNDLDCCWALLCRLWGSRAKCKSEQWSLLKVLAGGYRDLNKKNLYETFKCRAFSHLQGEAFPCSEFSFKEALRCKYVCKEVASCVLPFLCTRSTFVLACVEAPMMMIQRGRCFFCNSSTCAFVLKGVNVNVNIFFMYIMAYIGLRGCCVFVWPTNLLKELI